MSPSSAPGAPKQTAIVGAHRARLAHRPRQGSVSPDYPEAMRASSTTGIVVVACAIDEKGGVTDAKVNKSTNEAFDKSALEAVTKWKFRPATQDGKPVPVKILVPVKFTID